MGKKKYFAFISYSHKDSELAKWLQHEFEYYELPAKLFEERKDLRKEDLPESFRPIFRDEDELSGGELKPQISEALADSEYLIVVCSPNSAQSVYVDSEIKEFISLSQKNKRRIFPFIVDGKPHQDDDNKDKECFPKTLLELSEDETDPVELIAGDIHATGRDHAFVKILAGTLNEKDVRFADLWDRYAIEKAERERKEREEKEKLQIAQSRFVAEKANQLVDEGDSYTARLLALEVLPPNKPYTPEAEMALRKATKKNDAILRGHTDNVVCAIFSPNGQRIASASSDKTIRIWDAETGIQLQCLHGHSGKINTVAYSIDGKYIVSASQDKTICLWNVINGESIMTIKQKDNVNSAVFSPNGLYILSASDDNKLRIWEIKTGVLLKTIKGHAGLVNSAVFSFDGKYILSASYDRTVRLWDTITGNPIKTIKHNEGVCSAVFSPDDQFILSTSFDKTTRIWSTISGEKLYTYKGCRLTSLSPNGLLMAFVFNNHDVKIIDTKTGRAIASINENMRFINSISFSPNNKRVVLTSDVFIYICDIWTGDMTYTFNGHTDIVNRAIFSPDDKTVISASDDGKIKIWDSFTGKILKTLEGHTDAVKSVAFSPDGEQFISASFDGTVCIWDYKRLERLSFLSIQSPVHLALFNPANQQLVTFSFDKTIRIWDSNTGMIINKYSVYDSIIHSAALSPNGMNVISVFDDNSICIFDAFNGTIRKELKGPKGHVYSVAFSPDGKLIASSISNKVCVWDSKTGKIIKSFQGHIMDVNSVAFSSNGKLVSTSFDRTICVWDISSGKLIVSLNGHESIIQSAVFSHDGNRIVTASGGLPGSFGLPASIGPFTDYSIRIWEFPSLQKLINKTRERLKNRQLTLEEQQKYYLE